MQYGIATVNHPGLAYAAAPITSSLSGNVALNNTANYFDGPAVAQGTAGTWFVSGTVTMVDTAGAARFDLKLWDGTTVIATTQTSGAAANFFISATLSGFITAPAGNLRISVKDASSTSGSIDASDGVNGNLNSTITAIRIG